MGRGGVADKCPKQSSSHKTDVSPKSANRNSDLRNKFWYVLPKLALGVQSVGDGIERRVCACVVGGASRSRDGRYATEQDPPPHWQHVRALGKD